jgi:hypothetical protein
MAHTEGKMEAESGFIESGSGYGSGSSISSESGSGYGSPVLMNKKLKKKKYS